MDYKNSPGSLFAVTDMRTFPQYDLAVAYVPGLKNLKIDGVTFAATQPTSGTQGIVTSFADPRTLSGLLGPEFNGPIRAGSGVLSYPANITFMGIDPSVIGRTGFVGSINNLAPVNGTSGQGNYLLNGGWLGINIGGVNTTGYFLDATRPEIANTLNSVNFSAVPEPSSMGLAGLAAGVALLFSRMKSSVAPILRKMKR